MYPSHSQSSISSLKVGIVTLLAVLSFTAYDFFFVQHVAATDVPPPNLGDMNTALIATIDSIQLDTNLFSDPTFTSLKDFTVSLVPQPIGRVNPFAPFPTTSKTPTKPATKSTSKTAR